MKRSVWRWTFWISMVLLVLLILFTFGIWALGNVTGAMMGGIMGSLDPDNFGYKYLPLNEFVVNTIGSPIFYVFIVDLVVLTGSIVALIATKKSHK